jgi:GT2 family glycosyltransferase
VVHWHNEPELARLVAAWPKDARFELVVVDNGSSRELPATGCRVVSAGSNLGFGGGVNLGAQVAAGEILLVLNPDAEPQPGALDALLEGFAAWPAAAGIVPALLCADGSSQAPWQARDLPGVAALVAQPLVGDRRRGPAELVAGERVGQPAAAALALRRRAFEQLAGFDPRFQPAWFEDVDLAARCAAQHLELVAWPAARFVHGLGSSVPRLGYGAFLRAYHHNLERYLARHHGPVAVAAARLSLLLSVLVRLVLLPLRLPRRATSLGEAWRGLWQLGVAAATGWGRQR